MTLSFCFACYFFLNRKIHIFFHTFSGSIILKWFLFWSWWSNNGIQGFILYGQKYFYSLDSSLTVEAFQDSLKQFTEFFSRMEASWIYLRETCMFSIISAILKSASWEKEMVTNINHVSNFLQFDWLFWRRLLLAVTSNSLRSRAFWAGKSGTRFSKYCHHIRCITPRSRGFCCMKVWRNYFG